MIGSTISIIPASSKTVATQIELDPDIGGLNSGSIIIKAASAFGFFGGTSRFICLKTPPRGSFNKKLRNKPLLKIHLLCSQTVSPGGGGTPPTITSPTSPSAWAEITWIDLLVRIKQA